MKDGSLANKLTSSTTNDEILSTLLKVNNFDNSIKDESLDINLAACIPISTDTLCNNSFSSDFWKALDDNAQGEESNTSTALKASLFDGVGFTGSVPLTVTTASPSLSNITEDKEERPTTISSKKKCRKSKPTKELNDSITPTISNSFKGTLTTASNIPSEQTEGNVFKCEQCSVLLRSLTELIKHEVTHEIVYKCNQCENQFNNESALKKHTKIHRDETRKDGWKKCPDCGKCLKLGSMWMHRKIHSDNKKYGCDICGQKFVQKINLTHHSRVHSSEKPYECPECQKRFQERSHLQRHQKYHAQTRPFRCEKCGKMYKTERCLKVHNLVHLEQRPFACKVCDKSFISNSKLKQHSNIHTGERPYKCKYCTRDFTNFPNWLKHTRRRHKVDHKTGEVLEKIPLYCTKSGKKSANDEKPTKRKKNPVKKEQNISLVPKPEIQESPKTLFNTEPASFVPEPKVKIEPFDDLNTLTTTDYLIMQEALDMEECAIYDQQYGDQIIQFEVKNFPLKTEYDNNALCSLDSSPFSSPASIELPTTVQNFPLAVDKFTGHLPTLVDPVKSIKNRPYPSTFKSQVLPSVDTLLTACFKNENLNMK